MNSQPSKQLLNQIEVCLKNSESHIDLYGRNINDAQFIYLFTKDTNKIVTINAGFNKVTSLSMINMRYFKWQSLTVLKLGDNMIGDIGCKYLSRVQIPKIKQIYLEQYHFSGSLPFGQIRMEKPVKYLATHELSNVGWNYICFYGVKGLQTAKWSISLAQIYLQGNRIDLSQVYRLILFNMTKNSKINIEYNKIEKCYRDKLKSTLKLKFIPTSINL